MSSRRFFVWRIDRSHPLVSFAWLWICWCCLASAAHAQRGQFDKSPLNPADEAYIFTPPGFQREGKPAKIESSDAARLQVTIIDAATGQPTPCRVNIVGADGNFYQPADNPLAAYSLTGTWPETLAGNRPSKAPIRYFGRFFYTRGKFNVAVPAGPVRIEVWKGFEYRPEILTTHVTAGSQHEVQLRLTHSVPMAAQGWHSGDPHLHFIRASDNDDTTIFDLLEAEDMRLGMVLCYNETNAYPGLMPELVTPQLRGLGAKSVRRRGNYQIISGQEYRNEVFGHLLLFLRDRLVLKGSRLDPNIGPVFGKIGGETRAEGGYAFHAHGGYAQEIWADLVQEATQGVELLQFGIYRGIGLDGWYHVLNAGFRFPGLGACDYPACRKLGDCRTYVHIDGEPTFEAWLRGAAEGRSFMTSGPLVLLEVDGQHPGDTITCNGQKSVEVHLRVRSETAPVTDVQLVVNGQVARELKIPSTLGQGQWIELRETLRLDRSSWIAARAFSKAPSGSPDAESHTNPVYVYLNGKTPYAQESVDWLIARLDEQIDDHEARKVAEKVEPVEYFRRSREILMGIRQRGGRTATEAIKTFATKPPAAPVPSEPTPVADRSTVIPGDPAVPLAEFLKPVPPKSPADALATFEVQHGFRMELVAHEPDVVDPVAACFDEDGGMYVCEMIDYPYRPKPGQTPLGRVRYLQDTDDDGVYETSTIFAEAIVWPTGVACWQGGVYIAAAPDLWYMKDTDGDHRADLKRKVFVGFGDRNQQGMLNNLYWGIDHAIYGSGSTNGGSVRPAEGDAAPPTVLSGRDFRFSPVDERFETVTGSRQFGNAFDDWFNRFICSESKPLFHVVLPQQYLARNRHLVVSTGINDLARGVTPIFRTSPIERWREIRSSRRLAVGERKATSAGLSHNVIDAAAGLAIYRGHAYPAEYLGNEFIGCSQNNLIHRRRLIPEGASFRSERADEGTEFVRSTDTWFRPVNCVHAPDGTLYVLDMAREVIESVHIAHDVVAHLDLTNGREQGRIYRLAPPGYQPPKQPRLSKAPTAELVALLEHPGGWWRDTASRLIYERQDRSVVPLLRERLRKSNSDKGRLHILWALVGLQALAEDDLLTVLADASPGVREHALRVAESRLDRVAVRERVLALADDSDARVRFQAGLTLGELNDDRVIRALATIAARDAADSWTRSAVLSSCGTRADRLLAELLSRASFVEHAEAGQWFEELAILLGARNEPAEINRAFDAVAKLPANSAAEGTIILGLGAGLQRAGSNLSQAQASASAAARQMLHAQLENAAKQLEAAAPIAERQRAVRLLGSMGESASVAKLLEVLDPQQPEQLQLAVVATLARASDDAIAARLVNIWRSSTPKLQEEIIATLASRPAWAVRLLTACQHDEIATAQVPRATRTALANHADSAVRTQAEQLFGGLSARSEVLAQYQPALELAGDPVRGEQVFLRECQACHRLGERGHAVGPNLALVRNRTPAALLEAILDPNREVQPSYVTYALVDDSGRSLSGIITAETANGLTLARDQGQSETIAKENIAELHSTGKSLMPEGLEKTIGVEEMGHLLAFLKQVQYDIGTLPDFVQPSDTR